MKTRSAGSKTCETRCPRCDAAIHAPDSTKRRRVQCPKCRAIVSLGAEATEEKKAEPRVVASGKLAPRDDEIALLKARIEALEIAMAGLQRSMAASGSKMRWIAPGSEPVFSEVQADALRGDLSALPADRITIEAARGDSRARQRAEWFKSVFTDARWSVRGPEDAPSEHVCRPGISLATGLPVSAKAAATYLAVRAAGFEITTIFDADLVGDEPRLVVA